MKSSNPYLYSLPRRERDPIGIIFPSIGLLIWLGAASCWAATQDVARTFGYQPSIGRPLFEHIYSPFALLAWAIKYDHPARFGVEIHQVFVRGYEIVLLGNALGVIGAAAMAARRLRRLQRRTDLHGSAHWGVTG